MVPNSVSYLKTRAIQYAVKEHLRRCGSYGETKAEIHKMYSVNGFFSSLINRIQEEDTVTKEKIAKELRNSQKLRKRHAFPFKPFGRLASSSGTSSATFVFPQTIEAIQKEQAYIVYIWEKNEFNGNSKVAVIRGAYVPNLYYTTPRRRILCEMSWSEHEVIKKAQKLYDFSPEFIHCYPSILERFIKKIFTTGVSLPVGVRAVLCGSEAINQNQFELFRKVLNCEVVSWYGQSEQVALAVRQLNGSYAFAQGYSEVGFLKREGLYEIFGKSKLNEIFSTRFYRRGNLCDSLYIGWSRLLRVKTILMPRLVGRAEGSILNKYGENVPFYQVVFGLHMWNWRSIERYLCPQVEPDKVLCVYAGCKSSDAKIVQKILSEMRARINTSATNITFELESILNINIRKWRYFLKRRMHCANCSMKSLKPC